MNQPTANRLNLGLMVTSFAALTLEALRFETLTPEALMVVGSAFAASLSAAAYHYAPSSGHGLSFTHMAKVRPH